MKKTRSPGPVYPGGEHHALSLSGPTTPKIMKGKRLLETNNLEISLWFFLATEYVKGTAHANKIT